MRYTVSSIHSSTHVLPVLVQGRVSRCAEQCKDNVIDTLPPNPTQQEQERATVLAEECLMKCADTNIPLIKKMVERFKQQNRCL